MFVAVGQLVCIKYMANDAVTHKNSKGVLKWYFIAIVAYTLHDNILFLNGR